MNEYSTDEVEIFYAKILHTEMNKRADFIEGVIAGVGGCFGGYKEVAAVVKSLRRGGE